MKLWKREIFCRLAAASLRFNERIVNVPHDLNFPMSISTNEGHSVNVLLGSLSFCTRASRGYRIAALFAPLHRPAPEISKSVVTRRKRVVAVTLGESQRSII